MYKKMVEWAREHHAHKVGVELSRSGKMATLVALDGCGEPVRPIVEKRVVAGPLYKMGPCFRWVGQDEWGDDILEEDRLANAAVMSHGSIWIQVQ